MQARNSIEIYLDHYDRAVGFLTEAEGWAEQRNDADEDAEAAFLAAAQVHATLALAVAATRMVDSYNGWKAAGA
jgi:hypothetical protein